jgi:two-component system, LytTR family, response regulator
MISTILIESESHKLDSLKSKINQCCPFLQVNGMAQTIKDAQILLQTQISRLAFINPEILIYNYSGISEQGPEIIYISETPAYILDALRQQAVGYLFRPLESDALINTVAKARERIQIHEEAKKKSLLLEKLLNEKRANELIGIPTMEGFEFIAANEIVRCEGLQKCTRVVTTNKSDIISSYNIGEFIKLLEPYHFFSPHKSHLINLSYIRRYLREGTIVLNDKTSIPVSKRRKCEFLDIVTHL